MSTPQGLSPDRYPTPDFFLCDIFDALPKDDLATMEHPVFSLSTRPDRRILSYAHNGTEITVVPSVKGLATIHDKDILIYCISQLMAAVNAGRAISRKITLRAHDLLVATNRETSGDGYKRLREAFERLAGTRITTNLETGGHEVTTGFGLIESWQIVRASKGGRMDLCAAGGMAPVLASLGPAPLALCRCGLYGLCQSAHGRGHARPINAPEATVRGACVSLDSL